jgi:hypothetical protein
MFCTDSCADYVKHLIEKNKEKEIAIANSRQLFESRRRNPSDRESTTSDLTVESLGSGRRESQNRDNSDQATQSSRSSRAGPHWRKGDFKQESSTEPSLSKSSVSVPCIGDDDKRPTTVGSSYMGDQTSSGVSELTDSNKSSLVEENDAKSLPSRAFASEDLSSNETAGTRRDREEASVRSPSAFDIDYEAVFVKSNVPQLLSTTAGRIVTCTLTFFLVVISCSLPYSNLLTRFALGL